MVGPRLLAVLPGPRPAHVGLPGDHQASTVVQDNVLPVRRDGRDKQPARLTRTQHIHGGGIFTRSNGRAGTFKAGVDLKKEIGISVSASPGITRMCLLRTHSLLGAGLALILFAVACSSGKPSADGPFGNGGTNSGTLCEQTPPGAVLHDSFDAFRNTGGTARISKITLVDARHLRLVAAWVVPTSGPLGDSGPGYPRASDFDPGFQWALRQSIPGAIIRHTRGHDLINLVIVIKPTGKIGTASGVNLYYKSAGTRYLIHFPVGYKVPVGRRCH